MNDPRLTPANGRVAHESLRGTVAAERYVTGVLQRVRVPVADVLDAPRGSRQRQVLFGQSALALEDRDGHTFGVFGPSQYCGYVATGDLAESRAATHRVIVRATHLYSDADIKAPDVLTLGHRSELTVIGARGAFLETSGRRWVPRAHVAGARERTDDWVAEAEILAGTPYLWGGNSAAGIDCSGLVTAALGHGPGDSDQQMELGEEIPDTAPLVRGDLLFWKGHVAIVVDRTRLIHANVHHMAVAYEEIDAAIARIAAQGDGPVIARRRLTS